MHSEQREERKVLQDKCIFNFCHLVRMIHLPTLPVIDPHRLPLKPPADTTLRAATTARPSANHCQPR